MVNKMSPQPLNVSAEQSWACRAIIVNGRRTSLRMERVVWDVLAQIARLESMTLVQLLSEIDRRRGQSGLTAALRLFAISYQRLLIDQLRHTGMPKPIGVAVAGRSLMEDGDGYLDA